MRRYHAVLQAAAIRTSRNWGRGVPDEIDDILQEIYLRMCADGARVLSSFRDPRPDAVYGFLKVVATNAAHDFFRRRHAAKRGLGLSASTEAVAEIAAPDQDFEKQLSLAEIDRILLAQTDQKDNGPRDRAVFRLYYRYGMTAQAIAEVPGIGLTSKGVEGVLYRLTKSIRLALGDPQEMDRA